MEYLKEFHSKTIKDFLACARKECGIDAPGNNHLLYMGRIIRIESHEEIHIPIRVNVQFIVHGRNGIPIPILDTRPCYLLVEKQVMKSLRQKFVGKDPSHMYLAFSKRHQEEVQFRKKAGTFLMLIPNSAICVTKNIPKDVLGCDSFQKKPSDWRKATPQITPNENRAMGRTGRYREVTDHEVQTELERNKLQKHDDDKNVGESRRYSESSEQPENVHQRYQIMDTHSTHASFFGIIEKIRVEKTLGVDREGHQRVVIALYLIDGVSPNPIILYIDTQVDKVKRYSLYAIVHATNVAIGTYRDGLLGKVNEDDVIVDNSTNDLFHAIGDVKRLELVNLENYKRKLLPSIDDSYQSQIPMQDSVVLSDIVEDSNTVEEKTHNLAVHTETINQRPMDVSTIEQEHRLVADNNPSLDRAEVSTIEVDSESDITELILPMKDDKELSAQTEEKQADEPGTTSECQQQGSRMVSSSPNQTGNLNDKSNQCVCDDRSQPLDTQDVDQLLDDMINELAA